MSMYDIAQARLTEAAEARSAKFAELNAIPAAALTESRSLTADEDARAALARSDWVSLKIDSVDPTTWRQINQPHTDLALADILAGIRTFATGFKGSLVSETMLLAGINDSAAARRVTRLRTGSRGSTRLEKIWPGAEGGGSTRDCDAVSCHRSNPGKHRDRRQGL